MKEIVNEILMNDSYARQNDGYLIRRVLERKIPNLYKYSITEIFDNLNKFGISFESITRARRKFLEENPELKDSNTERARRQKELEFRAEYSKMMSENENHYTGGSYE